MENRQVSPPAEPSHRRASVDEIPCDASTRTGDAESREDADVLAAAREASSRDEAKKVAVEKRKREVAEISEEVTKKLKAEIQSPGFIQMLANAIQIDGRTSRENEASTDNEAVTSSHIQKGLMSRTALV
ncbi:hypothetical protein OROMI_019024 [Orobanche minor]